MNGAQWKPWPVVLLAIDPGKVSGCAIFDCGELIDHGTDATPYDDDSGEIRDAKSWVWCAYSDAECSGRRLVVAIEAHHPRGKWGLKQQHGLTENVGVWRYLVESLPKRRPATRIVRVNVQTWRAVFGLCKTSNKETQLAAASSLSGCNITDHNEAEAILIGCYACRSELVGKVLGKKEREGNVR